MDTKSSGKRRVWVVEGDDTEGEMWRWLKPEGDDTEGEVWRWLKPEGDDTEGQGRAGCNFLGQTEDGKYLIEIDTDEDVAGQAWRWLAETDEDVEGQVKVKFLRRADDDDTKGEMWKR